MMTDTTRRALLGGAGLASVALIAPAIAATATHGTTLEQDWQIIRRGRGALEGSTDQAFEDRQWAIIDAASYRILAADSRTPRAATIQLLVGMMNTASAGQDDQEIERLVLAEDIGGLVAADEAGTLDWHTKFYVRALVTLSKMEG